MKTEKNLTAENSQSVLSAIFYNETLLGRNSGSNWYWSSLSIDSDYAWKMNADNGSFSRHGQRSTLLLECIRR